MKKQAMTWGLLGLVLGLSAGTAWAQTSGCQAVTDTFSASSSLNNYLFYDGGWNASTAAAQSCQAASGEFQVAPSSSVVYPYIIATNSFFPSASTDYTLEGDFKLDTVTQGVFGLVFRSNPSTAHAYIFQWNGLNNRWEIEKQNQPNGVGYYYVASNTSSPYVLGTWTHLKVVVSGSLFNGFETPESAPGVPNGATVQIFTNSTDPGTTTPLTAGEAGIRGYNIVSGNILHLQNFVISYCPPPSPSDTTQGRCFIYPSPARGNQATLSYFMKEAGSMDLKVWNEKAELAAHITDLKSNGTQITPFSISGFASGVYFYRVTLHYDSGSTENLAPNKFVILH